MCTCDAFMKEWCYELSKSGYFTCCGLDGPWFEPRWWRDFPYPSRPRSIQPPVRCVPGLIPPGVKRLRRGADHPSLSSAGVEYAWVVLYLCCLHGMLRDSVCLYLKPLICQQTSLVNEYCARNVTKSFEVTLHVSNLQVIRFILCVCVYVIVLMVIM